MQDTNIDEPFRSKTNNNEKGCLIQILPTNKFIKHIPGTNDDEYNNLVWGDAKFIYPPSIEMSPYDCQVWCSEILNYQDNLYQTYYISLVHTPLK